MKQDMMKQIHGSTPDSFKRRVAFALQQTEKEPVKKRLATRTILIAALIAVLSIAVAYAAFSSQVTEFFGRLYGKDTQNWLEAGDVATLEQSFTLDSVVFTLDEVVYRNNGLYGVGTIRPEEGSNIVIIPEDHSTEAAYGYDVHGAGGRPEEAPAGTPTISDVVQERDAKLLMVRAIPDLVGVDGGEMLMPDSIGVGVVPQRDGSMRFSFEMSDAYAIEEGETYTVQMWVSTREMTADGTLLDDTQHGENWIVEMKPTPMGDAK